MTISAGKNTEMSMVCKLFILGILFVGVYIYALIDKIRKKGIKRRDEMLNDYSFFVSSIVLKMGAGLSVRETFMSIYRDMCERKEKGGLFEELRYMINGLNAGMDEKKVYSDMSKAVGIPEYERLMILICRNLERGNSNLLSLLKKEEKDAFMERKNRARKKGEEAAEKLLMPMLILLVAVIGIVMFPALMNL
jgi:Flp pilus assembly protein TadB